MDRRFFAGIPLCNAANSLREIYSTIAHTKDCLKPVRPDQYHLTLQFLGNISSARAHETVQSFAAMTFSTKPFAVTVQGLQFFPSASNASVLWAGLKDESGGLADIYRQTTSLFSALKFNSPDHRFIPHLTLARVKKNKYVPAYIYTLFHEQHSAFFCTLHIDRVVLYESQLSARGPEYRQAAQILL